MSEDNKPQRIFRAPTLAEKLYFQCRYDTAQDEHLTWEARGILWYLLSKPADWEVQVENLQQHCGRDKVYKVLGELRQHNYLAYHEIRDDHGKVIETYYTVHEVPLTALPETAKPYTAKPLTANTELTNKRGSTDQRKKQIGDSSSANVPVSSGDLKAYSKNEPVSELSSLKTYSNGDEPKKQPSEYQQFTQRLADICGEDMAIKSIAKKVGVNGAELWNAGYRAADLDSFETWWYANDWRGQKQQKPNLVNVKELIKQAKEAEPSAPAQPASTGYDIPVFMRKRKVS